MYNARFCGWICFLMQYGKQLYVNYQEAMRRTEAAHDWSSLSSSSIKSGSSSSSLPGEISSAPVEIQVTWHMRQYLIFNRLVYCCLWDRLLGFYVCVFTRLLIHLLFYAYRISIQPLQPIRQWRVRDYILWSCALSECCQLYLLWGLEERQSGRWTQGDHWRTLF